MAPKKNNSAKKKKANLGAARGFATTSIPKKVVEEVPEEAGEEGKLDEEANGDGTKVGEGGDVVKKEDEKPEWNEEDMERDALQALAEGVKAGSEKESSRLLKIYDYERRLSRSFPTYGFTDPSLIQRTLALALLATEDDQLIPEYDGENKVVGKIAMLWNLMEGLGFRKERIEECLLKVKGLEVDLVLDWLFLHCDASELLCDGPIALPLPGTIEITPSTPKPDLSQSTSSSSPPNSTTVSQPSTTPSSPPKPPKSLPGDTTSPSKMEEELRARILAYGDDTDSSSDEEGEGGGSKRVKDVESDANNLYCEVKLELSEAQRRMGVVKRSMVKNKKSGKGTEVEELVELERKSERFKKKLKAIEGDYTFRRVDAEKIYREARIKLDADQLAARLNGTGLDDPSPTLPASEITIDTANSTNTSENLTPSSGNDTSASRAEPADNEESSESLFGSMLEEVPKEDVNEQGTVIPVQDMALPKHFSGKTPKVSLEETVRKLDKYATITYRVLTRSRAVRAAVQIRWDGGRLQEFKMDEMACWDQVQAYNYIATVALFNVNNGATGVNKQLPLVFRDFWDELVKQKKEEEDEAYREQVKIFRTLAEARIRDVPSRDPKISTKPIATPIWTPDIHKAPEVSTQVSEQLMQELAARQQWPSYQEMLRTRATLPIAAYRSFIMSTLDSAQCVVLCGETGCGKSTQVPSFIVEHHMRKGKPVKVFCTEPRRISAISLAQRVSAELGEAPGACGSRSSLVGYSIRLDSRVSASSRIVYATTGIVLRMLEGAESLSDCTHLIIDEVHERSIDSDFLLIVLKEIMEVRKDLKVMLMSATVDAEKIAAYMGGCPVIQVPGRTFPVTAAYLEDVVELTQYKLGPNSDSPYVARSKRANFRAKPRRSDLDDLPPDDDDEQDSGTVKVQSGFSKSTKTTLECIDHFALNYDLITLLLEQLCFHDQNLIQYSAAILIFLPSLESIRRLTDLLDAHPGFGTKDFLVLPLHSTISNENQGLVFNIPRPGVRKIVIATNIAETGVTIPDITAVIDTGKHREMRFDEKRQISRLVETFVAQSNAAQRRGRAGRVREGIAFHLFTKQRHDEMMAEHPQPEITRLSLQDLALRVKIMKFNGSIEEVLSKALDPPLALNIQRAVASLIEVKALTLAEEITPLGKHLAKLPMDTHLGKFLIMSCIFQCLDAALTIAATLNSKTPWLTPFGRESEADAVKRSFKVENSDFLTLYNAYCSWRQASSNGYEREFCRKNFLSQQNFVSIEELRQQYFSFLVDAGFVQASEAEKRELISTRYGKSKTRFVRVPAELDTHSQDPKAVMACLAASMYPKLLVIDPHSGQMKTLANSAPAAIHPSSANFTPGRRIDFGADAKFIAFFTAMHTKKLYVWESGVVDERAVYLLCGNADFTLPAHTLSIDRKIRVTLEPKTAFALKVLRLKFQQFFNAKMKNPSVTLPSQQQWLDLVKEAIVTKTAEDKVAQSKEDRANGKKVVHLSIHRND